MLCRAYLGTWLQLGTHWLVVYLCLHSACISVFPSCLVHLAAEFESNAGSSVEARFPHNTHEMHPYTWFRVYTQFHPLSMSMIRSFTISKPKINFHKFRPCWLTKRWVCPKIWGKLHLCSCVTRFFKKTATLSHSCQETYLPLSPQFPLNSMSLYRFSGKGLDKKNTHFGWDASMHWSTTLINGAGSGVMWQGGWLFLEETFISPVDPCNSPPATAERRNIDISSRLGGVPIRHVPAKGKAAYGAGKWVIQAI